MSNRFKKWLSHGYLVALVTCTGCSAEVTPAVSLTYDKPANWQSDCVGRWLVDVPAPVDFGAAAAYDEEPPWFSTYGSRELRRSGLDAGHIAIAGIQFTEANPFPGPDENNTFVKSFVRSFESGRKKSSYYYPEQKDRYGTLSLKGQAYGFAWHGYENFYIGFVESSDQRARLFDNTIPNERMGKRIPDEEAIRMAKGQAKLVVSDLVPRYQVRKPGEIPTVPGICTPYGFFADPPDKTERDYVFDMYFRDPRYSNLILGIQIKTRNPLNTKWQTELPPLSIREAPTPWDMEREQARSSKENCRAQQGTASRDLLGCTLAGMTTIRKHREVEYLKIGNGQEARLLVMEYNPRLNEGVAYDVMIETAGVEDSPTQPRIVISARGIDGDTEVEALRGKSPPPIDEAVEIARKLALSLRLRPGAVDTARPVTDSLAGVR